MDLGSRFKLNDGNAIPALGLGTWKLNGEEARKAVGWALEAGYRHIDTATIYGNEAAVGSAIAQSGLGREEVFVTTKLWSDDASDPKKALNTSLKDLGLKYVDLYLIHWPKGDREKVWGEMVKLKEEGLCRSIGVSNFTVRHLKGLLETSGVAPAANQVEFSPFLYQKELLEFCKGKKIQVEAYSPLTRSSKLSDPRIAQIASAYGKSPAQVLIRWSLQHGLVALPKSGSEAHIKENANVFDFTIKGNDMLALDKLNEGFRITWDPEEIP